GLWPAGACLPRHRPRRLRRAGGQRGADLLQLSQDDDLRRLERGPAQHHLQGRPRALSMATIVVHHLENSRSQRVLWLLEELGVPYRIEHYKRNPATMLAPPELLAVHPLGK